MSPSFVFDLVSVQHDYAGTGTRRELRVDYLPLRELTRACNSIFDLVDREDDYQRDMLRLVWRLKLTVLQTLLPFDDERLNLRQMAMRLSDMADGMPAVVEPVRSVNSIVSALLEHPKNPKLELIIAAIGAADASHGNAIFVGLQGSSSPGWPADVGSEQDLGLLGVRLLRLRRDINGQVFSRLIIPGTLRFASRQIAYDLLYGGRAGEVLIVAYRGERIYIPEPLSLPRDMTFASVRDRHHLGASADHVTPDEPLDRWVQDSFWEGVRAQHADVIPTSDRDVPVRARFVLFADATGTFLPEDRTVVEVSNLLDRSESFNLDTDHMPRKAVSDLDEGDLVLLRLSGSGDYLDEVADGLMARHGRPELRNEATEWKSFLHAALKQHGEGVVARALRERGGRLRSASYLWVWAGDAVIAPQTYDTFRRLVETLADLVTPACIPDPDAYAQAKWELMESVKDYHRRAGSEIRAELLERMKALLADRTRIETVLSIDLAGLSSGRMGLLRVSAVDSQSVRVPSSRLFHIYPVKVA